VYTPRNEEITNPNTATNNLGTEHTRTHIQHTEDSSWQSALAGDTYGIRSDCEMSNHARKESLKYVEI
jgi:hypothetical protein